MTKDKAIASAVEAFSTSSYDNYEKLNVVLALVEGGNANVDALHKLSHIPTVVFIAHLLIHFGEEKTREIVKTKRMGVDIDAMLHLAQRLITLSNDCEGVFP